MKRNATRRLSDCEAIEATAAAWLAQRDHGLSPEQAVEFARWRAADLRHETAVARLENTWAALQQLRDFRPRAAKHPDRDLLAEDARRRIVPFPALIGAGMAAALAMAAVWWFAGLRHPTGAGPQVYATTAEGYERVSLEDGSSVELNSNSEISVQFTSTERRVRLVHGEAHFTVTKNPARPFSVDAGRVVVHAVGTAFNVRLGTNDIEVLVTEGKVELNQTTRPALAEAPSRSEQSDRNGRSANGSLTPLNANERAVISFAPRAAAGAPLVEKIPPATLRQALAWQEARLVFVDTPLVEVIAQFNRRNQVQLELADADLGALPIGGSFRAENVDAFVRLLKSGGDIAADQSDPLRIVLRKQK